MLNKYTAIFLVFAAGGVMIGEGFKAYEKNERYVECMKTYRSISEANSLNGTNIELPKCDS